MGLLSKLKVEFVNFIIYNWRLALGEWPISSKWFILQSSLKAIDFKQKNLNAISNGSLIILFVNQKIRRNRSSLLYAFNERYCNHGCMIQFLIMSSLKACELFKRRRLHIIHLAILLFFKVKISECFFFWLISFKRSICQCTFYLLGGVLRLKDTGVIFVENLKIWEIYQKK